MIKSEYVKVPSTPPPPFPPPGYLTAHDIRDANQSWGTLQALYGRESAWDIIIYNFNTTDPKEVNWYMGNPLYLGCVRTTGDRKNFRFSAKANPGILYIPPAAWRPGTPAPVPPPPATEQQTKDIAAKASVLRVLRGGGLGHIRFIWNGATIDRAALQRIADLVDTGRISVCWDPLLSAGQAAYESDGNTFFLSDPYASTPFAEAIIVHEAVHAVLDLRGKSMYVMESEAIAYLTQALYFLPRNGRHLTGSKALTVASEIADRMLYKNESLGLVAQGALIAAVFLTPIYHNDRGSTARYNGIP